MSALIVYGVFGLILFGIIYGFSAAELRRLDRERKAKDDHPARGRGK